MIDWLWGDEEKIPRMTPRLLALKLGERGKEISQGVVFDKFTHATSEMLFLSVVKLLVIPVMMFQGSLGVAML